MSQPQITVLENGLTVVTQHVAARQVAIDLAVKAGARHETKQEKGAAHFLEHMLLSDSEKYTVEQIAEKTDQMYGMLDGTTYYESVHLTRHCRTPHTAEAMELIADAVLRPRMDPQRFESERNSILREWEESGSDILSGIDVTQKIAFPASGLEKSIDGSKGQIKRLKPENLQSFRDKHFTAPNMVLTVVGDVTHEDIVAMAKQQFAALPAREAQTAQATQPARYRGGERITDAPESESTDITLSFPSSASSDVAGQAKDLLLCGLLAGSSDNNRLDKALRFNGGDVYGVQACMNAFMDAGTLSFQAECDAEKGTKVMEIMCREIGSLAATLTQEELDAAKKTVIGELEREEPTSTADICETLSSQILTHGRPVDLDEQIAAIESLSIEDVKAHAHKTFSAAPSISVSTDFDYDFPDYAQITAMLGKERQVDASGYAIEERMPSPDRSVGAAEITAEPARAMQQGRGR